MRESESQPRDVSADNSGQQHPRGNKLSAEDNPVVPAVCILPARTVTSTSRSLGWFSCTGVTQEGLGQRTAKKPDYNHETLSPTPCFQWHQFVLTIPSCSADCTRLLLMLSAGSFPNGRINSRPKFLEHLRNLSPGSVT